MSSLQLNWSSVPYPRTNALAFVFTRLVHKVTQFCSGKTDSFPKNKISLQFLLNYRSKSDIVYLQCVMYCYSRLCFEAFKNPQNINSEPDRCQQDSEPSFQKRDAESDFRHGRQMVGIVREHGTAHKDRLPKLHLENLFRMSEIPLLPRDSY